MISYECNFCDLKTKSKKVIQMHSQLHFKEAEEKQMNLWRETQGGKHGEYM